MQSLSGHSIVIPGECARDPSAHEVKGTQVSTLLNPLQIMRQRSCRTEHASGTTWVPLTSRRPPCGQRSPGMTAKEVVAHA